MKRHGILLLLVILISLFAVSHANALLAPNLEWVRTYDSPTHGQDRGYDVSLDSEGNVYVAGKAEGDIWIRKYSPDGDVQWTDTYDSPNHGNDECWGIAANLPNCVYVIGNEERNDLGQSNNIWLRKYNTDGTVIWTRTHDSLAHSADYGRGIALDDNGNVCVSGFENHSDLGEDDNIWIRQYDMDGNINWTKTYDSPAHNRDRSIGIAVDPTQNVYATGYERRDDLCQDDNIWLRKYNADGGTLWTCTYDSPDHSKDLAFDVTVDPIGNVFAVGKEHRPPVNKIWLCKYNEYGNVLWTKSYAEPNRFNNWGFSIAVDAYGSIYVTGESDNEIWLGKFSTGGNLLWTTLYNSPGNIKGQGWGIAVDEARNIYITGYETLNDLGQGENIILLKYNQWDIERISADTVGTVFNPDVGDGLGRITFSQETPIEIDWENGTTEVVEGGSIVLWADMSEDTSEDGLASGYFEDGEFAIWGDEGEELLIGEVDWLMMEELFDGMGIMGGAGRIIVTGGELMDSFGTMGEVVDITFNIDPRDMEDFSTAFTGESNITLQPVIPEPASIILVGAAIAGLAAFLRGRIGMKI